MSLEKIIEVIKEERKKATIKEAEENTAFQIGLIVTSRIPGHKPDCKCFCCLTRPEPFYTHPEIHKKFVDCIFEAVRG